MIYPPPTSLVSQALKSENHDLTQKIVKLEDTLESLQSDHEAAVTNLANSVETIDALKQQLERKVSDENQILESKQVVMLDIHARDLEKGLDLVKDDLKCKNAKIMELENELATFKSEAEHLRSENKNLEVDLNKTKKDFLEVTRKLTNQHNEHQTKVKELESFRDRQILEDRKMKREERKEKKKEARKKKNEAKTQNEPQESLATNNYDIICTICAKPCEKSELSAKGEPEESDTCRGCNPDAEGIDDQSKPTDKDPLIETLVEEFGEFLENFTDDEGSNKYEARVKMLVNMSEHILDVSCTDIRAHNLALRKSLEIVGLYSKAFPHLCRTIKAFVETKVGHEAAKKYYLLRLVT